MRLEGGILVRMLDTCRTKELRKEKAVRTDRLFDTLIMVQELPKSERFKSDGFLRRRENVNRFSENPENDPTEND
jgi:hypothetical protein